MWKGEELRKFGGSQYKGAADPKDWRSMAGSVVGFRYSGTGKPPEPVEYDGSLRANAVGLSVASRFLDGAKYRGPVQVDERLECFLYSKGGGCTGFLWAKPGKTIALAPRASGPLKLYDLMGNPVSISPAQVSEAPVYFTCQGGACKDELARAMGVTP
jgi:hypothetical protein